MKPLWPRLAAAAIAALAALAVVATYDTFSHVWDEPAHIAAGMELLDTGRYTYELQHPPLARAATALGPYLDGVWSAGARSIWDEGRALLYDAGDYDRVLLLARLGTLPFVLLALAACWAWARHLFDEATALVAVLLLATAPPLLGHAGLATTDAALTALGAWSLFALALYLEAPSARRGAFAGLAAGLAFMTKFSALPFFVVSFAAAVVWRALARERRLSLRSLLGAGSRQGRILGYAAFLAVCWAAYGFAVSPFFGASDYPNFLTAIFDGMREVAGHNKGGHVAYLLGEIRTDGWWYFFPVMLAVKTPLPLLGLGLAGTAILLCRSWHDRDWRVAAPGLFFLAILAFAMTSRINIGVRHVLILYPLLAVTGAFAAVSLARARPLGPAAAVALLAWQVSAPLIAHPDHMSYFNALAGERPERVAVNSDLDWGQDLKRLAAELRARKVEQVAIAYAGTAELDRHGLPDHTVLLPQQPVAGWVAISLRVLYMAPEGYGWLRAYEPVTRVGSSIDLYRIDEGVSRPLARCAPFAICERTPSVLPSPETGRKPMRIARFARPRDVLATAAVLGLLAGGGGASADGEVILGLGDSIGAGVQSADASYLTQPYSYLNLIAHKVGVPFVLPWIVGGPFTVVGDTSGRSRVFPDMAGANLAVSGADVASLLRDRADALTTGEINSETDLILFPRLGSQIEIAEEVAAPVVLCWIGSNDVLSAVLSFDQLDASQMTPVASFTADFEEIVTRLTALGNPVVYANIPGVTEIAFLMDRQDLIAFLGSDYGLAEGDYTSLVAMFLIRLGLADGTLLADPNFVLDATEAATIDDRIDELNQVIADTVAATGMPVVDINTLFATIAAQEPVIVGIPLTARFLGGMFSLDGVHPSNFAHAVIANAFIATINAHFGVSLPLFSDDELLSFFLTDPFVDKDGDRVVSGRPLAGLLETLGPLVGISGDPDDLDAGVSVTAESRAQAKRLTRADVIAAFKSAFGAE